jgi:hypothetical protein
VEDINDTADTALQAFRQRLETISGALEETVHPQSIMKIKAFAGCVQLVICSADAYVHGRRLIEKARELDKIRGSSTWRKVLETDEYTGGIERIVNEMKEATDNFCVSSSHFISVSRVATAEVSSPSDRLAIGY